MKPKRALRKRRTREHIIADLSVNHVERFAFRLGYSVERPRSDYGVDLTLFTYNRAGEVEGGVVFLQLKASDKMKFRNQGRTVGCRIQRSDLLRWLAEPQPVILVVYDAAQDVAYWLYLRAYFTALSGFKLSKLGKTTTVYVDRSNVVDEDAICRFARFRDAVAAQQTEVMHHV